MLKFTDCRPGVEIICIKCLPSTVRPPIEVGQTYTINQVFDHHNYRGKIIREPGLTLMEILPPKGYRPGINWAYLLQEFKLKRRDELVELFNIQKIPILELA